MFIDPTHSLEVLPGAVGEPPEAMGVSPRCLRWALCLSVAAWGAILLAAAVYFAL